MIQPIPISRRTIGPGAPCFIAAEIGINHNGNLDLARDMVRAAAAAGADGVKFQNYSTEDFLSDRTLTYTYRSQGKEISESQWEMFRRCELHPGWLGSLAQLCESCGVVFFATPTSERGVRELVELHAPLIKNGSDYLTHIPLLEVMGSTGIPVILSTGMADECDIDEAVAAVRRGGPSNIILLHCTSVYPTPPTEANLCRMTSLMDRYHVPVGFSDHTEGWVAATQAVTLGACFIEKHFTIDHQLPGPDHWFSSTQEEFAEFVRTVRLAEQRLGRRELQPSWQEAEGRRDYRVSAVAARDLRVGERLNPEMIAYRRPGTGILPKDAPSYLAHEIKVPIAKGTPLQPDQLAIASQLVRAELKE